MSWELHREHRTPAKPGALCEHGSAMQLDQMLHDREAQSEAPVTTADRSVCLSETFEYVRKKFRVDPLAVVFDTNPDEIGFRIDQLDANESSRVRELDTVREQIPDDLLKPLGVSANGDRGLRDLAA